MHYKNILLIDDDEDDQEIFLSAVASVSLSVQCVTLSDATEALEKLLSQQLQPDLIFLDLNMPVMNGEQFLAALKIQPTLKHIPVIIFSTSSQPATMKRTIEMGATSFITKPGHYNELVNLLAPLLLTS